MSQDEFVTVDIGTQVQETQKVQGIQRFLYISIIIGTVLLLLLVGAVLIWQLVLKD